MMSLPKMIGVSITGTSVSRYLFYNSLLSFFFSNLYLSNLKKHITLFVSFNRGWKHPVNEDGKTGCDQEISINSQHKHRWQQSIQCWEWRVWKGQGWDSLEEAYLTIAFLTKRRRTIFSHTIRPFIYIISRFLLKIIPCPLSFYFLKNEKSRQSKRFMVLDSNL